MKTRSTLRPAVVAAALTIALTGCVNPGHAVGQPDSGLTFDSVDEWRDAQR